MKLKKYICDWLRKPIVIGYVIGKKKKIDPLMPTKAEMKEWEEFNRFAGRLFPDSDNHIPHADTGLTDAEQILSDLLYPPYLVADPFSSDKENKGKS
jgi:hypothetical protein